MLTKNFYEYISTFLKRSGADESHAANLTIFDGTKVTHALGKTTIMPYSLLGGMVHPQCVPIGSEDFWYGTWFGTGTTPATADDYTLESPITDGTLSFHNAATVSGVANSDHYRYSMTYDVTNTGSEDITVSEIGLFSLNASSGLWQSLLDHTVLETPITVPAGQTVPINYTIKLPYGT